MSLADEVARENDPEWQELQRRLADAERRAVRSGAASRLLTDAQRRIDALERQLDLLSAIDSVSVDKPRWAQPKKAKRRAATVNLMLSDLHLDEVVNPDEIGGVNAYNREIATLRLRKTFDTTVKLARDYVTGMNYDGCCVMLGGDLFSGDIHDELVETNEGTILESLDYWIDPLAAGLDMLADTFGHVYVPVVVGNHGRRTRKPRAKKRVRDNFDWFLARQLAREFKDDKRVQFNIPDSADCRFTLYDTDYLLTHGDQFRGGNGIAGIWSPIMRGHAQKTQRQDAIDQPYDVLVMGHWHQYIPTSRVIVNGSLKGYDEYAYTSNFAFEVPQQAFWLTTPEHQVTSSWPIRPADRSEEGW